MVTLAICDDDITDLEKMTTIIKEWRKGQQEYTIQIKQFSSPFLLLDTVTHGESFDIFLLDILMPEMTGITLGEHLQNLLVEPILIFFTSSEDYYPDAFRLYAFQYIRKPINENYLLPILDKALLLLKKQKKYVFTLKTAEGIVQIPLQAIMYAELLAHICHFYLADGQHLQSLYLRTGFDKFLQPLLQQKQFVKTHTSFVVNLDYADKLTPSTLLLKTGIVIPVTRSYASQVQQRYIEYGLRERSDF